MAINSNSNAHQRTKALLSKCPLYITNTHSLQVTYWNESRFVLAENQQLVWQVTLISETFENNNSEVSRGGVPGSTLVRIVTRYQLVSKNSSGAVSGTEGEAVHRIAIPRPLQEARSCSQ